MTTHPTFWIKLDTMLSAGVPLTTALETLTEDIDSDLREVIAALEAGRPLSEAVSHAPALSDPAIVATIRSGEARGGASEAVRAVVEQLTDGEAGAREARGEGAADAPPMADPVGELLTEAFEADASDVHVEPTASGGVVRFRLDGQLRVYRELDRDELQRTLTGLKVMARLDAGERGRPQDGRALLQAGEGGQETLELRVAVGPTVLGEAGTVRLLRRSAIERILTRPELVIPDAAVREALLEAARSPYGLLLATGPSGCGKTSTLYTLLAQQDVTRAKVMTVEDPVEVRLPGVHQIQLQPSIGLSFPSALRHALRMDPDVIFCSEIRDAETAALLLRIATTGHRVLSQLHSRGPVQALTRLLHIGLEPHLLADALLGIVSQRLVRKLCPSCAAPSEAMRETVEQLTGGGAPEGAAILGPVGCPSCDGTGYRGRRPIFELMTMGAPLRRALLDEPDEDRLKAAAREGGTRPLLENGLDAVYAGETSIAEVLRVCH